MQKPPNGHKTVAKALVWLQINRDSLAKHLSLSTDINNNH